MQVFPVIHFLDRDTAISEADLASRAGAAGVFLISHGGDDDALVDVAVAIKRSNPSLPVGINLLTRLPLEAALTVRKTGLDMVWADYMGVDSRGLTDEGRALSDLAKKNPQISFFASVAFKYRSVEADPDRAARHALDAGFIPTTSGIGTGSAPDVGKIRSMSAAAGGTLAVASGMTPGNVAAFAPYLSHILVATGVAIDEYRIDEAKLRDLIALANHGQGPESA